MVELPGVHRVRMKLAKGYAEYWYAWRGGPRILTEKAATEAALASQVRRGQARANSAYIAATHHQENASEFLAGLITAWLDSPEFEALAPRTKRDLRKHLSVVSRDRGTMPLLALKADDARNVLLDWRDKYRARPRTADHYLGALAWCLAWGRDRGKTSADPLRNWPRLYKVDRSSIIWTSAEIEAVCAHAEPDLLRAILLAVHTGLRQGDLLKLTWSDVGDDHITRRTAKRGKTVHIPISDDLRELLDCCPRGAIYVATREGQPWKVSTLEKRFSIARAAAGISGKRWHDFRGTFATLLFQANTPIGDVARIMGWSKETAEEVSSHYVSGEVIAMTTLKRLRRFTAQTSSPTISKTETDGILHGKSVNSKARSV